MNSAAAILNSLVLYRYSLVLALAAAAGICFFFACCNFVDIPFSRASAVVLTAVVLSLILSRFLYWYGRPDRFSSLLQALTSPGTESYALAGTLAGCALSAVLTAGQGSRKKTLDCMCVAGCWAIAMGRLACFFTESNRGQIMTDLTGFPWAYPVITASGALEYRFATFLFQAAAAAVLGIRLTAVFSQKKQTGKVTILFVLFYSASQIILDSTRYDSLYLRSNGFISLVQIFAALALVAVLVFLCIRAVQIRGMKLWMVPLWIALIALLGGVGYSEYYVQRHGRQAFSAYCAMGSILICIVLLGVLLLHLSQPSGNHTENK